MYMSGSLIIGRIFSRRLNSDDIVNTLLLREHEFL